MKKMKFLKLSRVLIIISLLAIISVSLISVPVSAAEGDSIVGTWVLNDELNFSGISYITQDCTVWFNYLEDGELKRYFAQNITINGDDINSLVFRVPGSSSWYPRITMHSYDVWVYLNSESGYTAYTHQSIDAQIYNEMRTIEITDAGNLSTVSYLADFLELNATRVLPPQPTLLENILGTFSEVGSWIGTIISSLVALFWSFETASLTFLGILSVAGLAFSTIMLLFGIVTRFVGFSS